MIYFGFVGLIGLPNVGKSSFLNHILGEKLSIVSGHPQSTRRSFRGVLTHKNFQIVFFDAPGFIPPRVNGAQSLLTDFLISEFEKVMKKSDHLLFLVSHRQEETLFFEKVLKKLENCKKPISFLFTKSDLKASEFVNQYKVQLKKEGNNYFETSIKDKNPRGLMDFIKKTALSLPKEQKFPYDPSMFSLDSISDIISEFIREQCFLQLKKEVPFGLGVIVISIKNERKSMGRSHRSDDSGLKTKAHEKSVLKHIHASIIVEKEGHKAIVIGQGGQQLKKIGERTRLKIENLLGERVFLKLHVSCKKKWTKNPNIMKEMGYHNVRG